MDVTGASKEARPSLVLSSVKGLVFDWKKVHHSLYGSKEARRERSSSLLTSWLEAVWFEKYSEKLAVLPGLL